MDILYLCIKTKPRLYWRIKQKTMKQIYLFWLFIADIPKMILPSNKN